DDLQLHGSVWRGLMGAAISQGVGNLVTVSAGHQQQANTFDANLLSDIMPPDLASILGKVINSIAAGDATLIDMLPHELPPAAAAGVLGISRPALMSLLREGQIPAHKVGSHTRLRS